MCSTIHCSATLLLLVSTTVMLHSSPLQHLISYFLSPSSVSRRRPASADASEACFRQSLTVERELIAKKLDFTKVDLAQTPDQVRSPPARSFSTTAPLSHYRPSAHALLLVD